MEIWTLDKPAKRWAAAILRWVLGGIFIYAGVLKALDPIAFTNDIANYQLVSWPVAVGVAFYLPWLEIFCGAGLIFNVLRAGALRVLFFLMLVFVQALATAWLRGLNIECGCFGRAFSTSNYFLLFLRDLIFLAGLLWLLLLDWKVRISQEEQEP